MRSPLRTKLSGVLLERQERYQQETPEQREAEKAWIDQQRQQLEQVQRGIEAILNDDS